MNEFNITQSIRIVNSRVASMLNSRDRNLEVFMRDIRTLTELIEYEIDNEARTYV
jgi:hypothetical protein